jgi:hypothetical protein
MTAAAQCIREIFPGSSIKTVRIHNFRARLKINTDAFGQGQEKEVWSGKQSNLCAKTPKRRKKAMDIIKSSLADLRETLPS